jgi:hypothetical protein
MIKSVKSVDELSKSPSFSTQDCSRFAHASGFWLAFFFFWIALNSSGNDAVDLPRPLASQSFHAFLPPSGADYYVATGGSDANAGTAVAPFRTLARARDAVRLRIAAGLTKDLLVQIAGGRYKQTGTVSFGPADSGTAKVSITYTAAPNESVLLSGGERIVNWTKGEGPIWTTRLPEVVAKEWYFRQLFVNGVRAIRARTPNANGGEPWCPMISSTAKIDDEEQPVSVQLGGYSRPFKIADYQNPGDMELVYINNNDEGRKSVASVNEKSHTITLATPNRWNSKTHILDWYLSFPDTHWKACYLENAREMLDEPGEWYLDRRSGLLSYWPRPDEDMTRAEVFAPVVQRTLLEIIGTRDQPVVNLHFRGLHVEHVDWPPPEYGYMGLFCCIVDSGPRERLENGFIEAAVEYRYARSCDFTDGSVSHVGGMGICLRQGTADIVIEGNEVSDVGAGGVGASEVRQAPIGQRAWNPLPRADDYQGYRIANNHIHDCGTDYYGAVGITLGTAHDSVIVHNLIHDIAYSGIQWAGDADEQSRGFTRNNTVAYNHVYRVMKTTVDGGGIYVTFAHGGDTVVRGNLIHDVLCNPFRRGASESNPGDVPCHGLYLDGNMSKGRFENNVVYRNAGGPLLFNSKKGRNDWFDNLFQKNGTPPDEFLEVMEAVAGLEPTYRKRLIGTEGRVCRVYPSLDVMSVDSSPVHQFHLPAKRRGLIEIFRRPEATTGSIRIKLRGLESGQRYALKAYRGILAPAVQDFYAPYTRDSKLRATLVDALGDLPILSDVEPLALSQIGLKSATIGEMMSGDELAGETLKVELGDSPQVVWIAYEAVR